jgi:hypothetical protein
MQKGIVMAIANKATKRRSKRFKKLTGKLYAEHVRIDRQGYDSSGRYWGVGGKLYRVSSTDEIPIGPPHPMTGQPRMEMIDSYIRAPSAKEAKQREYEHIFGKD